MHRLLRPQHRLSLTSPRLTEPRMLRSRESRLIQAGFGSQMDLLWTCPGTPGRTADKLPI